MGSGEERTYEKILDLTSAGKLIRLGIIGADDNGDAMLAAVCERVVTGIASQLSRALIRTDCINIRSTIFSSVKTTGRLACGEAVDPVLVGLGSCPTWPPRKASRSVAYWQRLTRLTIREISRGTTELSHCLQHDLSLTDTEQGAPLDVLRLDRLGVSTSGKCQQTMRL